MRIKTKVLVFIEWFTPAYKAGGPIRAIENLVQLMYNDLDIYILTGDRDLAESRPFEDVIFNTWLDREGRYNVFYANQEHLGYAGIKCIVEDVAPDVIYLNSMYAFRFFMLPLLVIKRMGFQGRIVLAPRGMLKDSALQFKTTKKKWFLRFMRFSSLMKDLFFQATDEQELRDIQDKLKVSPARVFQVADIPFVNNDPKWIEKKSGELNLIFNGRIHPIKGLDYILEILAQSKGRIYLRIAGWQEDENYYQRCLQLLKKLPVNVQAEFLGSIPFEEVIQTVENTHMLVLATHGENFGHAIFEAFSSARPVIISNQTPWENLEKQKAGWDIPLEQPEHFVAAIEKAVAMDQQEYDIWSDQAYQLAKNFINTSHLKERYLFLYDANPMEARPYVHTRH